MEDKECAPEGRLPGAALCPTAWRCPLLDRTRVREARVFLHDGMLGPGLCPQ